MAKIIPITEHFQHFLAEMKESFWGDLYGQTQVAWQRFFELQSERERDRFSGAGRYERRRGRRRIYRNGYYERDFVTRFGTIRLRIARTREKSFLPVGLRRFQRRGVEVSLLIREAFLRGISTRQVGRVVATITGEMVSAQTVSKLTRDLDEAVRQFHQARLKDDYAYLFLDGVSLRVRRPTGRKQVQMLVAYGIRRDGSRHLLAFLRSQGESQADWEGLLQDLYQRGLEGRSLGLILTDYHLTYYKQLRTSFSKISEVRSGEHIVLGKFRVGAAPYPNFARESGGFGFGSPVRSIQQVNAIRRMRNGTLPQNLPQRHARRWCGHLSPRIRSDSGLRANSKPQNFACHRDAQHLSLLFGELRRDYLYAGR